MNFDSELFKQFISSDCNRGDFIVSVLKANGVKAVVMPVAGKNHIYVVFPQSCYNPAFKIKTVIAHYDRVPGSPGANDNSAAVFSLMQWAVSINNPDYVHNVRLIFTDGEELGSNGISEQGAFGLASVFKRLNIKNDEIYVFDCMGRGTIPVIAKSNLPAAVSKAFRKSFQNLEEKTVSIIKNASGKFVILPVSYSDNAGFMAYGLPAVAVTMLPDSEASLFMMNLMKNPLLENFVLNNCKNYLEEQKQLCRSQLPETWKKLHTTGDNFESLQPESFAIMFRILNELAKSVTMA